MELTESSDLPSHLLAPEAYYQPRPWRPLWFLILGRFVLILLILTPAYVILNRIALYFPWMLPVFTQPVWMIVGGVLALYSLQVLYRWRRASRRWSHVEARARECLKSGALAEAGRELDEFCRTARQWRLYHAQAILLRAEVYLRENRSDRAFGLLASVQNSHFFESGARRRRKAELQNLIAFCFVVQNDLDAAEQWLGLAHVSIHPKDAALLLPLQMAIAVRRGRHAVVLRDAEAEWPQAEAVLDSHMLGALALLCAMASHRLNEPSDAGWEASVARWLQVARSSATPLDWLATGWPDLREFMRVHGLTAGSSAD